MPKVIIWLFSLTLASGAFLSLSTSNPMTMYIGLEVNMYSFILLLSMSKTKEESSTASMYLMIQAVGSYILLMAALTSMSWWAEFTDWLTQIALLLKMGTPPAFCWYPNTITKLSWPKIWILATFQKMAPVMILTSSSELTSLSIIMVATKALVGGIGGLIQTQLPGLLAYSSMTHMSWILMLSLVSPPLSLLYFLIYSVMMTALIIILHISATVSHSYVPFLSSPQKLSVILLFLSMAGLPPTLGFLPKLHAIQTLMSQTSILLTIFLIAGSLMNLYYYLNLLFTNFLSFSFFRSPSKKWALPLMTTFASISFWLFIPLLWHLIYYVLPLRAGRPAR